MTTPKDDRFEPPTVGDERALLDGFLDFHRDTLLWKCAGLTREQLLSRPVPSTTLSLLGLVRHLADVERSWFRQRFAGEDVPDLYYVEDDPDRDFNPPADVDAEEDFAVFRAEVLAVKETLQDRRLDETFTSPKGRSYSLRWVYLHLIEEYARHNGHADLLREAIDGVTGE